MLQFEQKTNKNALQTMREYVYLYLYYCTKEKITRLAELKPN